MARITPSGGGGSAASSVSLADKGAWVTSTAYVVGDVVTQSGYRYIATTAHTAGTFATDKAAGKWTIVGLGVDDTTAASASQVPLYNSGSGKFVAQGAPSPGPTTNLNPVNYYNWRKAAMKVRAGSGFADILCIGDSTTEGNKASAFAQNYPSLLAALLNSYYIPAFQTWAFPHNDGTTTNDPRVTVGAPWSNATDYWQNTSTVGTLSYQPSAAGAAGPPSTDTCDIWYFSNTGTFDVNVDGGATLATSTASLGTIQKLTVTYAAGAHTVNVVSKNNGNVFVVGFNAYLSTSPCVRVGNRGVGASKSADWAVASPVYVYPMSWTNFAPSLVILDLGINDAGASVSNGTFQTNMQTIITRAVAAGADVLLKSMVPSGGSPYTTIEPGYVSTVLPALAVANNEALLDVFTRWGSYATANTAGWMFDTLHPNTFGYADVAQAVFNVLKTI